MDREKEYNRNNSNNNINNNNTNDIIFHFNNQYKLCILFFTLRRNIQAYTDKLTQEKKKHKQRQKQKNTLY